MTRSRLALRGLVFLVLLGLGAATVPRVLCGRDAEALYAGELEAQDALARAAAATIGREAAVTNAGHTGDARFDGEWALVTQQMLMMGLGQLMLAHPARQVAYLPALERGATRLQTAEMTAFGTDAWREQGLRRLDSEHGHAYLGYLNLALGMLRLHAPETRHAQIHDRLTEALARRLAAAPHALIETYPGETYPADVAMVAASIALHDQAASRAGVKSDHQALLRRYVDTFRAAAIDPRSGLVFQRMDARSGLALGPARASGTALCVYALSFVDRDLSRDLFAAVASQRATLLSFGGVREFARSAAGPESASRRGDVDSGPVVLGVGVSATGFAVAGARLHSHLELFTELYRTVELFGIPVSDDVGRRFLSGGALGNAIMLAMLTATWERGR